jgi:hypothetical protein
MFHKAVFSGCSYISYTADLPTSPSATIATFADDTAVLALGDEPATASQKLQTYLNVTQSWLQKWRMQANTQIASRNVHHTYWNVLTWHHIFTKRKQLGLTFTKMYWLLRRRSQLSLHNKLLYKIIFKPIWTYGIQLWSTPSTSNNEILERLQSKTLRMIVDARLYVPNTLIHLDLQLTSVKEEISSQYSSRLTAHPNNLPPILIELPEHTCLRRKFATSSPH